MNLNALPLVIAPLEKRSMEIDGVEYNLYLDPDHDYFSEYFSNIRDTIKALITEAKDNYELDELDLYYAFKRINLVEVPIQYHAYERPYFQTVENILPEMILMPEKGAGLSTLDFERFKKAEEKRTRNMRIAEVHGRLKSINLKGCFRIPFSGVVSGQEAEVRIGTNEESDYLSGRYRILKESLLRVPFLLQLCYWYQLQGISGVQLHAGDLPEGRF